MNDIFACTLEEAGYEPRSYSGRGMYGRKCVGVALDASESTTVLAVKLAASVARNAEHYSQIDAELEELIEVMEYTCTDSLGRGTIVYWPKAEWSEQVDHVGKPYVFTVEVEDEEEDA
jgi:hypothetical protein